MNPEELRAGQTVRLPDGRCAVLAFHDGKTARVLVEGQRAYVPLSQLRPVGDGPTLAFPYLNRTDD